MRRPMAPKHEETGLSPKWNVEITNITKTTERTPSPRTITRYTAIKIQNKYNMSKRKDYIKEIEFRYSLRKNYIYLKNSYLGSRQTLKYWECCLKSESGTQRKPVIRSESIRSFLRSPPEVYIPSESETPSEPLAGLCWGRETVGVSGEWCWNWGSKTTDHRGIYLVPVLRSLTLTPTLHSHCRSPTRWALYHRQGIFRCLCIPRWWA